MTLRRYILIMTALMTAIGFSSTLLVEEVAQGFKYFAAAATLICFAIYAKRPLKLPHVLWNLMAVAVFALFLADYLFITRSLIGTATKFLMVLAALKLLDLNTNRDYVLLYSLIFFELLSSAASTVSPLFFVNLTAFIICSIWTLLVFNIKGDIEVNEADKDKDVMGVNLPRGLFGPSFITATFAMTAFSILITISLFFVIPRMSADFFNIKTIKTIGMTGFSNTVELGEIGSIKNDPTVIMRVELPGGRKEAEIMRFRGGVLDYYDGKAWNKTLKDKTSIQRSGSNVFLRSSKGPTNIGNLVKQDYLLEPLQTNIIFSLPAWVRVEGSFSWILTDSSGAIYLPAVPYKRLKYTAYSLRDPSKSEEAAAELTDKEKEVYLRLPPETGRIAELAKEVTEGVERSVMKAYALETYLQGNYSYTLEPGKGSGETPLDDFLFYQKKGYCEQYATALAVMLRTQGVPTRLVTGFLEGYWNKYGDYILVRQQDAHTWVEAYINGRGWVTFDPTPSSGLGTFSKYSKVLLYLDALKWKWNKHIINFTFDDQVQGAAEIQGRMNSIKEYFARLFKKGTSAGKDTGTAFIALGALITVAFLITLYLAIRRLQRDRGANAKTPEFYIDMLLILRRRGIKKEASETPLEFAGRTGRSEVCELTALYNEVRYGDRELTTQETRGIEERLVSLKSYKKAA